MQKEAEYNNKTGERLKAAIKAAKLTQKELGESIGYTGQYISDLCRGKKPMTIQAAQLIGKKLNVRADYLLCKDDYRTEGIRITQKLYHVFSDISKWDVEKVKRVVKLENVCKEAVEIYGYSDIYSEILLGDMYPLGLYMDDVLKNALDLYFKMYSFGKSTNKNDSLTQDE